MAIAPLQSALASPLTSVDANLCCIAQSTNNSVDLERAADKAEEASENIYEGLDTTKEIIGKTEMRKQAIENAREHASDKWQSLADKAREASRTGEPLSPVDELNLKRLSGDQG